MVNCLPPRMRLASMKTMSPPTGVQTRPMATPGLLDALFDFALGAEFRHTEEFAHDFGRDHHLVGLALGEASSLLADQGGDLAFQVAHTSFASVAMDDLAQACRR